MQIEQAIKNANRVENLGIVDIDKTDEMQIANKL